MRPIIILGLVFSLGFLSSAIISGDKIARQQFQLQTSGTILLSEEELKDVADKSKEDIYWAGPLTGYSYSLTLGVSKSAIVRYLPNSDAPSDNPDSKRAIATYPAPQAWAKSLTAAARPGITSFRNSDQSLVFYDGRESTSVFMAFPQEDIQIEIFDARIGQALNLALLVGQIQKLEKK